MKTLILYSSRDGQTRAIASCIAHELQGTMKCDVQDIAQSVLPDLNDYDCVIIGASIRYGHFNSKVLNFVRQHADQLNGMPSAFFSVNLTARKADKSTPQTNAYTRKFLLSTPWKPDMCHVFAGALRYPRYGWFDKMMIKLIMRLTGGETDTTKEVEYTDWQHVSRFAHEFTHFCSGSISQ